MHFGSRCGTLLSLIALSVCLLSCGDGTSPTPPGNVITPDNPAAITYPDHLVNSIAPLQTPTFDGSGQAVHPGIVEFAAPWHGYKYWMSVTPYPYSDKALENPSILASSDGIAWQVPPGLVNPIAKPDTSFLADADLFYDAVSEQLWVYYVQQNVSGNTQVLRTTSPDGVTWSTPRIVLLQPDYRVVSPSVVKTGDTYWMWYVNAHEIGSCATSTQVEYRTSADGVNWSLPARAALEPAPGHHIWHIDVIQVPSKSEYWMLQSAIPDGTHCADRTELFFATSGDGRTWTTFSKVVLAPGTGWDDSHIYRSTLLYDPAHDLLRVWYSGRNAATRIWGIGYTEASYPRFRQWLAH